MDKTTLSAGRNISTPSSVIISTPSAVILLYCTWGYILTLSFANLSRKYFLNIQNLASMAGSGNVMITLTPFFSARKKQVSQPTCPAPMATTFFPTSFCPDSTSRQFTTVFPFMPGIGGTQGVEPTATMTASGANFLTSSAVAPLLRTTFTPVLTT